uniref:Uncharacterized protein n=1 Tax=Arion vulgaris TaxID=1028688 RepID=A0A0B7BL00_9EUPU
MQTTDKSEEKKPKSNKKSKEKSMGNIWKHAGRRRKNSTKRILQESKRNKTGTMKNTTQQKF